MVHVGGLIANERYDEGGRWIGAINFAGNIFPRLQNYTEDNRATSIGNQLLSNYRKFLYDYERAWRHVDLRAVQVPQGRLLAMSQELNGNGCTEELPEPGSTEQQPPQSQRGKKRGGQWTAGGFARTEIDNSYRVRP